MREGMALHRGTMRRTVITALGLLVTMCLCFPAFAQAEPVWEVQTNWGPTNLAPGKDGQFAFRVRNLGDTASTEPPTLEIQLPPGVHRVAPIASEVEYHYEQFWSCTDIESSGVDEVTCTADRTVPPRTARASVIGFPLGGYGDTLKLNVAVDPSASGEHEVAATLSGGGASDVAVDVDRVLIDPAPAGFGMRDGTFVGDVFEEEILGDARARRASSHPYELRVDFQLKTAMDSVQYAEFPPRCSVRSDISGRTRTCARW